MHSNQSLRLQFGIVYPLARVFRNVEKARFAVRVCAVVTAAFAQRADECILPNLVPSAFSV
jgi:hypothetical protein